MNDDYEINENVYDELYRNSLDAYYESIDDDDDAYAYDDAADALIDDLIAGEYDNYEDEMLNLDEDYLLGALIDGNYDADDALTDDLIASEYQSAADQASDYQIYDNANDVYEHYDEKLIDELYYDENEDEAYDRALDELYSDLSQYYDDYDGDDYDYEDVSDTDEFGITERDHWHDTTEDNDWIVSSLSTTDLDNIWQDPSQWELVDKVRTESGRMIQRKCLHMWHQRLCLCQFLEWIDDAKYKCYPRGEQVPIMRRVAKPTTKQAVPKVVKRFRKVVKKIKTHHAATGGLLQKLKADIAKLERLRRSRPKKKAATIESGLAHKAAQHKTTKPHKEPTTAKLIKDTITSGNGGIDAMEELHDVAKTPQLVKDTRDPHSAQLGRIETLIHHLVSLHADHQPHHFDGGPHNIQLSRIEKMLLHLAARKHLEGMQNPGMQNAAGPYYGGPHTAGPYAGQHYGDMPMMQGSKGGFGGVQEEEESSSEDNPHHGYTSNGEVRKRYRHSERLWRKRQRGIGPGQSKKKAHGLGKALGGLMKGVNKETDEALNSPRQYFQGAKLPTFGDHPGHGDISGTGFKGDIPNVPLHWHLAGVHAPNIGPQQHLIMSQPAHPDYPRKSYYMVITGYPKYGLPENRPNWIPSYMWSQMQALQHRGIDVANQLDEDNLMEGEMTQDYDDYDYYMNNGLGINEDEQQLETYYEDYDYEWLDLNDGEQWVIMKDEAGLDDEIVSEEEWNNDELWELMEKGIRGAGFKVEKKCMMVFGRPMCLCQFVDWVLFGTMKKQCAPKKTMKVVKPPKSKPKWMPHNFWGYLNHAEAPHKPPSEVNRKKWKLYLKFKKKGYNAKDGQFGDYMLYDDDEEMMDALMQDIDESSEMNDDALYSDDYYYDEEELYDNALLDALIDSDYTDYDEAAAILDELLLKEDENEMYADYEDTTDALLKDLLVDEDKELYSDAYYQSADDDEDFQLTKRIIKRKIAQELAQKAAAATVDNYYGDDYMNDDYEINENVYDELYRNALDAYYESIDDDDAYAYDDEYQSALDQASDYEIYDNANDDTNIKLTKRIIKKKIAQQLYNEGTAAAKQYIGDYYDDDRYGFENDADAYAYDDDATDALMDDLIAGEYDNYEDEMLNVDEDYLLGALIDGNYDDSAEEARIIDQLLRDEEKHAAKESLAVKLLQNAYETYEDALDDDDVYEDNEYYLNDDEDVYDDDEYYLDDDEDVAAKQAATISDWWVDEDDSNEWVVTDQSTNDFDDKWPVDQEWDQVSKRIRTKSGHLMTRKCLSIWKKRLCFCQFLNWIDGKKYKCLPRTEARQSPQEEYEYATSSHIDQDEKYQEDITFEAANEEYQDELYSAYGDVDEYKSYEENYNNVDQGYEYEDNAEEEEVVDEYLQALLASDTGYYTDVSDDNKVEDHKDDAKSYIVGDGSKMNYMQDLRDFMHDTKSIHKDLDSIKLENIGDYSSLNEAEKDEYNKEMSALQSYMDQLNSYYSTYADDDYNQEALAQYKDDNYAFAYKDYNNYNDYNEDDNDNYFDEDESEEASFWSNANDAVHDYYSAYEEESNDDLYDDLYDGAIEDQYYESDDEENNEQVEDEWSNANKMLNNYYESEQQQLNDEYSNLYDHQYDDLYDMLLAKDSDDDGQENDRWSNANDALDNEYDGLYDNEYDDLYDNKYAYDDAYNNLYDSSYDNAYNDLYDDAFVDEYDAYDKYESADSNVYTAAGVDDDDYDDYGYDEYNENSNGYVENDDDDYYDDDKDSEYDDDDEYVDNDYYDANSAINDYKSEQFNGESEYNDIYDAIYDEYDTDDDDAYDDDPQIVYDLDNNAWVWQLLILSFSLGVCSCLCYYATKIKPSGGSYDFSHFHRRKGAYNKVSFESAQSAYDHDDIIEHPSQSDIEQSN